ncbi:hypothetical protein ERHA55_32380 [Erwinia rhapontici]|nr:hypothetical protein ERHA55_32380 [Erwinia rhapontici]
MKNMSTRNKPDGNALLSVVERFVTEARKEADADGAPVSSVIHQRLAALSDMVGDMTLLKSSMPSGADMNRITRR